MCAMNWKTILADLRAAKVTQAQIAQQCGCAQTTISSLATGDTHQPIWPTGVMLLALHKKAQRKTRKTTSA